MLSKQEHLSLSQLDLGGKFTTDESRSKDFALPITQHKDQNLNIAPTDSHQVHQYYIYLYLYLYLSIYLCIYILSTIEKEGRTEIVA